MICSICGTENDNSSRVCMKCGCSLTAKMNDEPFIPRLDAERVSLPQPCSTPMPSQQFYNPYMNQPPPVYSQPQIIGYDPNGVPVFAPPQPMYSQYAPPQIIGYDPNGVPIFATPQPMYSQYAPPQIIGYDPNGMPVFAPLPPMYNQYIQQQSVNCPPPPVSSQNMQSIPVMPDMPALAPVEPEEKQNDGRVDVPDDFWAFFDGGKSPERTEETSADDFFGKSAHGDDMGNVALSGMNIDSIRRKNNNIKKTYMNDTPVVDASKIEKNDSAKFARMYMKKADNVNSNDLGDAERKTLSDSDRMSTAKQADAGKLPVKIKVKSKVSMSSAGSADADMLEVYVPEHKEALMAQADRAVEAMPKRSNPYQNELDAIELPEYMQAKKTQREKPAEIPCIPPKKKN